MVCAHIVQTGLVQQGQNGGALVVVMLHQQAPSGSQGPGGAIHDFADRREAIHAAIEGEGGLVQAHRRIELGQQW